MIALEAKNIVKYFNEPAPFQVLKGLDLKIMQGEFTTIMGKSGCGKSTLLYILSTMDTEYEGELMMQGEKVTGLSGNALSRFRNKHIGFVFQFHYLLPEFTVLKNVMLPALKLGQFSKEEIEHRAIEKLKLLGVDAEAKKLSSKLSGGQQQRVAIARALINDPSIIMGDEPTGNLDSANSRNVFEMFKELAHSYKQTIIAVTHDNDFAAGSDRTIRMEDGRILANG